MALTVRERLEKLKDEPFKKEAVLTTTFFSPQKKEDPLPQAPKRPSLDTEYQNKLEKSMLNIEKLMKKMLEEGAYLLFYNNLKEAENEFLRLLAESETKGIFFEDPFNKKLEEFSKKVKR